MLRRNLLKIHLLTQAVSEAAGLAFEYPIRGPFLVLTTEFAMCLLTVQTLCRHDSAVQYVALQNVGRPNEWLTQQRMPPSPKKAQ